MKIDTYSLTGTKVTSYTIPELDAKASETMIAQVVNHLQSNKRYSIADTKTRGEVRGGGIKPWKQKGTGRARAGSSRSPLWRSGGVTFGPLSAQNYATRLPRKMHQIAMQHVLLEGLASGTIKIVESFDLDKPKTSTIAVLLTKMEAQGSVLIVTDVYDKQVHRSITNIPAVDYITLSRLNALDIMRHSVVLCNKAAIQQLFNDAEDDSLEVQPEVHEETEK